MDRAIKTSFLVGGIAAIILTAGFFFQMPWATGLWMWPEGRLTYIFFASITAAIAAPLLWMYLSGQWGAAMGGAINLLVQAGGIALFLIQLTLLGVATNVIPYVVVFGLFALTQVGVYFWSRRFPVAPTPPTPRPVYISFIIFVVLLVIFALALLLKSPNIFPWPLPPDTSVIIGWVFAGTAVYFSYPFTRRGWNNAAGQLLGFLAYDLVLIFPFLAHFSQVLPEHRLSLTIYTGVLIFSGSLAAYYLFIHKPTRIWPSPRSID